MTIAAGFVLRAVAGGLVISVPISEWLLVCTILLALFLGLSKRRHEFTLLAGGARDHRRILEDYDPYLLDQMIAVVAASTLVAYIIYCLDPEHRGPLRDALARADGAVPDLRHSSDTSTSCIARTAAGTRRTMLLTDRPLLACVALWGLAVVAIIYRPFGS